MPVYSVHDEYFWVINSPACWSIRASVTLMMCFFMNFMAFITSEVKFRLIFRASRASTSWESRCSPLIFGTESETNPPQQLCTATDYLGQVLCCPWFSWGVSQPPCSESEVCSLYLSLAFLWPVFLNLFLLEFCTSKTIFSFFVENVFEVLIKYL